MKKLTNPLLLVLLITAFVFSGCTKDESPVSPADKDLNPNLALEDGKEGSKSMITPADLIGTWTLAEIYPGKKDQVIFDLSYTFNEEGSGQVSKEEESMDFAWSLNEEILQFTWDEDKTSAMAAFLFESDLYLVEKCMDKWTKDEWDKDKRGHDKRKKGCKKMKFVKEQ